MIPIFSLTLHFNIQSEHESRGWGWGVFKENSGTHLRTTALAVSYFSCWQEGEAGPCLPLSGFSGLSRLDGAPILSCFSFLRSISDRYGEDHRFLCHRDDLLICPLLAQMLLGVVKALHGLWGGRKFEVIRLERCPQWQLWEETDSKTHAMGRPSYLSIVCCAWPGFCLTTWAHLWVMRSLQ